MTTLPDLPGICTLDPAYRLERATRPLSRVTRELDILVVADPDTMSSKAKQARERGVRILAEPVFWTTIGVLVE